MSPAEMRIVIADDNEDAARALHRLLTVSGYCVVAVTHDGRAAFETIQREHPTLALLDIGMPGMRGDEVAKQLQNEPNRPYLVAITGWSTQHDQQSALAAGFDEVLAKPVAWQQIEALLMRLMTLSTDKECASANHLGRS